MKCETQCLTDAELRELAADTSVAATIDKFTDRHLKTCDRCRDSLDQLRKDNGGGNAPSIDESPLSTRATPTGYRPDLDPKNVRQLPTTVKGASRTIPALIGKYPVDERIGRGGQGEVYRVRHPELKIDLVAKVYFSANATKVDQAEMLDMLRREGRVLSRLNHPMVARIYDMGIDGEMAYVVMEHIAGRNLRQRLSEYQQDPEKSMKLVADIAQAIQSAHSIGIVHGDLKPENVVIGTDGRPKVIDFGLARIRDAWRGEGTLEHGGGTPAYMPPEQARCEEDRVGPASDVFSLGAMLLELLTKKRPYSGDTKKQIMENAGNDVVISIDKLHLNSAVKRVLAKALAVNPDVRYRDAGQFQHALEGTMEANAVHKNRLRYGIASLIVVCLLVLLIAVPPYFNSTTSPEPPSAIPAMLKLTRGEKVFGSLEEGGIPGFAEDQLQANLEVPTGLDYVIFCISNGGVECRPDVRLEPIDRKKQRLYWPKQGSVKCSGLSGTEVVLICGAKKADDSAIKRWTQSIEEIITAEPLQKLPESLVVRFNLDDVTQCLSLDQPRSLKDAEETAAMQVERRIQLLRRTLGPQIAFLIGEAFPQSVVN